ncbi:MAG: ATP-binding protein [Bernardetiaceae bacterium]|nr:ATP-binding protein [Bernardetiaceae bacterium]
MTTAPPSLPHLTTALLETSTDAFLVLDLAAQTGVWANGAFRDWWRLPGGPDQRLAEGFLAGILPADLPGVQGWLADLTQGKPQATKFRLRPEGPLAVRWVEATPLAMPAPWAGLQLRDVTGTQAYQTEHAQTLAQLIRVNENLYNHQEELKASLDELRQANQQLAQSRQEIDSIVQNASEAILSIGPNGLILHCNTAGTQLFGLKAGTQYFLSNLVARPHRRQVSGFVLSKAGLPSFEPKTQAAHFRAEVDLQRADNKRTFAAQLSISQLDPGPGFVAVVTDLSKLKQRETELQRAREVAEQAAAAKAYFLSNMSHEIRTPLTAIIGYADLLRAQLPSPEARQMLHNLDFAANNLLALINDVLDFSKIETGLLKLEPQPFHLPQLLDSVEQMFAHRASAKQIELRLQTAPGLPTWLLGDSFRLTQILTNLLGNAIKFTHQGLVSLEVRSLSQANGRALLQFAVQDTGIGIAPELQSLIFERFTQVHGQPGHRYAGTGLGLAIVKHLVQLHGGHLQVSSQLGQGTTFTVDLPFALAGTPAPVAQVPRAPVDQPLRGRHIMVADDNEVNQLVVAEYLGRWGAQCQFAANGQQLLQQLAQHPTDLVLLDLNMPEMDGLTVMQALAQQPSAPPVVVLTADASPETAALARQAGARAVLTKPFKPADLLLALAPWLPKPEPESAQAPPGPSVIDVHFIEELRHRSSAFLPEFLALNLTAFREFPAQYAARLQAGEPEPLHDLTHKLMSNIAVLRFDHLRDLLRQGELLLGGGLVPALVAGECPPATAAVARSQR